MRALLLAVVVLALLPSQSYGLDGGGGASKWATRFDRQECTAERSERTRSPDLCAQAGRVEQASEEGLAAEMRVRRGDDVFGLPLASTSFESFVVGTLAETRVTQRFVNPYEETIEAVYVFPLPRRGAVHGYTIKVQDRTIAGVIKRREEAQALYHQAKSAGQTAGLLEQERPNIFTQSIANIPAGEAVTVELRVVQPLEQDAGRYTLVFPTVVGPRFSPGTPVDAQGDWFVQDATRVPDASRITPAFVGPGTEPCARLSVEVRVEAGLPVLDVRSKSHAVWESVEDGATVIRLEHGREALDRDFELSFSRAGKQAAAALMVQPQGEGGYFSLTVQPSEDGDDVQSMARELVFVADNSGSMSGAPIATAKAAMRKVLAGMGPRDVFQILKFSESASALSPGFLPNTEAQVARGLEFVDAMAGMGGTYMVEGIRAALRPPSKSGRMRVVLFFTDGYIGNEKEIFTAVSKDLGEARLFSLGVGSSVNRYLLDGLAKMGRGAVTYMDLGEDPEQGVARFYDRIDRPVLKDVRVEWGGLEVDDVVPDRIPDLFAGQPLVLFGRYRGTPRGEVVVVGERGDKTVRIPVELNFDGPSTSSAALSAMWARERIAELNHLAVGAASSGGEGDNFPEKITQLSLAHQVMSRYTAFVAVDEGRVLSGTIGHTVPVRVARPRGVALAAMVASFSASGHATGGGAALGRATGASLRGRVRASAVRFGKPQIQGSPRAKTILRTMRKHHRQLLRCYAARLRKLPRNGGRIRLKFIVESDGAVKAATVTRSSLKDPASEQCITRAVRRWKFPQLGHGGIAVVTLPLIFSG